MNTGAITRRTTTAANVKSAPIPVNATFVLPNDIDEHLVFEVSFRIHSTRPSNGS